MLHEKWQLEEIQRCRKDPVYYISKYCKIIDPVKGQIPFKLFPFQKYAVHCFLARRFNIMKKPRQMGCSNLSAAYAHWMFNFHPFKNTVVISIKDEVAVRFLDKVKHIHRHLPEWMKSTITNGTGKDVGTTHVVENDMGSRIQSVASSKEAGRSEAVSLLILDEAAFIEHIDSIWAAAYPTLSQGGMCIMLSTTNGVGNLYHKLWVEAVSGVNDFNPIELNYTMYPGRDHEWAALQLKNLGKLRHAQEVLCAFLSSGKTFFPSDLIRSMDDYITEFPYPLMDLYPFREYLKNRFMRDSSTYEQNGKYGRSPVHLNQELLPSDNVRIWQYPQPEARYCMGCDVAKAATDDNDYQALQIVDYDTNDLVFEYCGKLTAYQYARLILYLAEWYNGAFTAVEANGVGASVIELLLEFGFPEEWFYTELKTKRRRGEFEEDRDTETIGFTTTASNKPAILQALANSYEDQTFTQKSMIAVQQHYTYVWNNNKIEALSGYSDDLVMASAITQQCRQAYTPYIDL